MFLRFPFSCYSGDGKRAKGFSPAKLVVSVASLRAAERSEAWEGGFGGKPGRGGETGRGGG